MPKEPKKTRVRCPPAEVVGKFIDVLKAPACEDGRKLMVVELEDEQLKEVLDNDLYILASTEHQAALELLRWLRVKLTTVTQKRASEKYREYILKQDEELARLKDGPK